jgi:hypothetical protein
MSLGRLAEQFRIARVNQRAADWATITVKHVGPLAEQHRFAGRVLVDCRMLGYLVNGEPRTFDVEPGEHTITIFYGRKPAILSSRSRAKSAVSVVLSPGERADFVCGIRSEVAHRWAQARRAGTNRALVRALVLLVVLYLIAMVGYLLAPYLRQGVALAVFHLPVYGSLIPLGYRLVNPFVCACLFMMLAWWLARRTTHFPREETDEELLSRIGSPYYLERLPAVDGVTHNLDLEAIVGTTGPQILPPPRTGDPMWDRDLDG